MFNVQLLYVDRLGFSIMLYGNLYCDVLGACYLYAGGWVGNELVQYCNFDIIIVVCYSAC